MSFTPAGAPMTFSTSATSIGAASAGDIPVASARTAIRILIIGHTMMEKPILTKSCRFIDLTPRPKDHGLSRECITAKEARSCLSRDQNPKLAFQGADLTHGFYLCPRPERLFAGMRRRCGTVESSVTLRSRALGDLLTDKQANNRRNAQQADSVNPPLSAWDRHRHCWLKEQHVPD